MITVTLLTQTDCDYCDHAKAILGRLGREYDLHITEVDMTIEPGRQIALNAGILFPPGVLLDDTPVSHGRLSERALRRSLHRIATPYAID